MDWLFLCEFCVLGRKFRKLEGSWGFCLALKFWFVHYVG